jgi:hypothetical protein
MPIKVIELTMTNDYYDFVDVSGLQYFRDLEFLYIKYASSDIYDEAELSEAEQFIKYFNTLNLPSCLKRIFIRFNTDYNNVNNLSTNEIIEMFNTLRLPYGCKSTINISINSNDDTNYVTNEFTIANGKIESIIDVTCDGRSFNIHEKYIENKENYFKEEILELKKVDYCYTPGCNFDDEIEKQKRKWLKSQNKKLLSHKRKTYSINLIK